MVSDPLLAITRYPMIEVLPDLIRRAADRSPQSAALCHKTDVLSYEELAHSIESLAAGLVRSGLKRAERVAVYAGKRTETVIAAFGASLAGGVLVPINILFKSAQVTYILNDCDVRVLVTTKSRLGDLVPVLESSCPTLRLIVVIDDETSPAQVGTARVEGWSSITSQTSEHLPQTISSDIAAIMYTSGSTGLPKGVVLSHANMTIGAQSVAKYLANSPNDRILAVLPLSFDAGLSQLTTGFSAGSCIVLHDYLLPSDVVKIVKSQQVTGITGVPPLWMQLASQKWPAGGTDSVRYIANTGGKMPRETLIRLREIFPKARPYLMYGLTEAFRSTYLPPEEAEKRPDSIGKAIPNAEVMVVAEDGSICGPGEVGELVHRGPLVALGYWNDVERTKARFRPAPNQPSGLPNPELAVWSGDSVKSDEDGFLYFVGRKDDMIKTSGYRVSPAEIEELAHDSQLVGEVAAVGVPDSRIGQKLVLVAKPKNDGETPTEAVLTYIRQHAPNYMVPASIEWRDELPRNPNGKLDRRKVSSEIHALYSKATT